MTRRLRSSCGSRSSAQTAANTTPNSSHSQFIHILLTLSFYSLCRSTHSVVLLILSFYSLCLSDTDNNWHIPNTFPHICCKQRMTQHKLTWSVTASSVSIVHQQTQMLVIDTVSCYLSAVTLSKLSTHRRTDRQTDRQTELYVRPWGGSRRQAAVSSSSAVWSTPDNCDSDYTWSLLSCRGVQAA